MDAQAIITISAAVVALVQLVKWAKLKDEYGPFAVLILAGLGIAIWAYDHTGAPNTTAFDFFAAWIAVATSAAGVFGFTRASSEAITSTSTPPAGGGGSSRTVKMGTQ